MKIDIGETLAFHFQRNGADVDWVSTTDNDIAYLHVSIPGGENGRDKVQASIAFTVATGRPRRSRTTRHLQATVMVNPKAGTYLHGGKTVMNAPRTLREFMAALAPHLPTVEVWHPSPDQPNIWSVYQIPADQPDKVAAARAGEDAADSYASSAWEYRAGCINPDGVPSWWQFI